MTHHSIEEWQMYVKNELTSERRQRAEDHLYTCDQCLELYFQAGAEFETDLPDLQHMEDLTDRVMIEIQQKNLNLGPKLVQEPKPVLHQKPDQKPGMKATMKQKVLPFYQTAIFHYTLAAVATIVLMMTGVFQNITHYTAESVQSNTFQEDRSSVTEGIVNSTFSWLDSFETKHKEANSK